MVIFLYGKDTYRLSQKLREIEEQYKKIHKSALNLEKIDVQDLTFREFWNRISQTSMFIKKKLVFLENLFSNENLKKEFLKKVAELADSEDIIVVIEKQDIRKADKLFQALKKQGKSQEFNILSQASLKKWIRDEFEKNKVQISEQALQKLIDFTGQDLWQLSNEIKKLSCFKAVLKEEINSEDVELLVRPKIEVGIFETIDALAQRNKKKALRLVQEHLEKGDSPFYILSMINFQMRNLLIAKILREKGKTLNDLLRMNFSKPYPAKKAWIVSSYFTLNQLKKIYQKLFEADLGMKTGKITPEDGLSMLVAGF